MKTEPVYLEQFIQIGEHTIGHSESGLKHMIKHIETMLAKPHPGRNDQTTAHMQELVKKYNLHLQAYEQRRNETELSREALPELAGNPEGETGQP